MKNKIYLVVPFIILIGYFTYIEHQLFFYGKKTIISGSLPLNIKPNDKQSFEGGFSLEDSYGFSIIGKGVVYKIDGKNIEIDKVIEYGYNKPSNVIIAIIKDIKGELYYLKCFHDKKSLADINVSILKEKNVQENKKYLWVQLKNKNNIESLMNIRSTLFYIILGGIMLFLMRIFLKRGNKKNDALPSIQ